MATRTANLKRRARDPGARWRNPIAAIHRWQQRDRALPKLFITWYAGLSDAAHRALIAKYSLALLPQHLGGPSLTEPGEPAYLDDLRIRNPTLLLLGYQQVAHYSNNPGVGDDIMRTAAAGSPDTYLRNAAGQIQQITDTSSSPNITYNLLDYRKSQWLTAFLAACDAVLAQYSWDGLFLDNCTALWTAHTTINHGALRSALQRALVELRRRHPDKLFIGNCIERWPMLNGKMAENRPGDWAVELIPPFGATPRMDLAAQGGYTDENDPDLTTDMTAAHGYGAWFGAVKVAGAPYDPANALPWPPVFANYVTDYGVISYLQHRIDNGGTRLLNRSATLIGITNSQQLTFSGWFRRDVLNIEGDLLVGRTVGAPRFVINFATTNVVRVRYVDSDAGTEIFTYLTTAVVDDHEWHYVKVLVDMDLDEGSVTIDDVVETFFPHANTAPSLGGLAFDFANLTAWRIGGDHNTPFDMHNGGWADVIFDDSIISHPALSYNNGVPLDISGVMSGSNPSVAPKIKLFNQVAAEYQAGGANVNGSGGTFSNVLTAGAWTDVQGGSPSYGQNLVDNAGTRYLVHAATLTGVSDSTTMTLSGWVKRNAIGVAHYLISSKAAASKLAVNFTAQNALHVRYVTEGNAILDFTSSLVVADTSRHYVKVTLDLNSDNGVVRIDGVSETITLSENTTDGPIAAFDFTACTEWRLLTNATNTFPYNGAIADLIWDDSLLTDASLAYNGGTPLDPFDVVALINLSSANAESFYIAASGLGRANNHGSLTNVFDQAGSGSWTDV